MRQDSWKYCLIILAAGVTGFLTGHTLLSMLLAALGIIAWLVYRINLLYLWVLSPKKNPIPETSGQLYLLHKEIKRRNIQNQRRKKKFSKYLQQFRKAFSALPESIVFISDNNSIEWANRNALKLLGVEWPKDAGIRLNNLVREPAFIALLENMDSPDGIQIISPADQTKIINISCIRYTPSLRMIIANDVSRLVHVNKMQKDFVANVSHELKTPLTVLRGYLETLQAHPELPNNLLKPIDHMSTQSDRMRLIVNDLLFLSKLEDLENKSPQQPIDMPHMINNALEALKPLNDDKQHSITLNIDSNIQLNGNELEIQSALSNLILNAINYTPKQGKINIQWQPHETGAMFSVTDNGIGIAQQHISRITERFYRVDDGRSRDKGGTGLGLAIVKHAIQRHQGELTVNSEVGVGSQFSCLFPASILITKN